MPTAGREAQPAGPGALRTESSYALPHRKPCSPQLAGPKDEFLKIRAEKERVLLHQGNFQNTRASAKIRGLAAGTRQVAYGLASKARRRLVLRAGELCVATSQY
eukprot:3871178-Prymnesium_polylepis.2